MAGKPVDRSVLAAVLTPIGEDPAPDLTPRIDQGCDGFAVLGTTSEATSFR